MLPRLDIPETWRPPADGEVGAWEEEDTPREPRELAGSLPASPSARKTKSRAARTARGYVRTNSLRDAKVLLVSDMHRTESMADPSLFQYHQHFESPWQLVGKTSLSEVFRVRHRDSGQVFAVKRSRRRFRSKLQRERCLREIRAVAALPTHPNIVNQYRAWQEGGHFYIQMDFCEWGSLAQQVKACRQGHGMSDEELWGITCQAAQGLAFLHSHRVMHLDIKPDNIYLSAPAPTQQQQQQQQKPSTAAVAAADTGTGAGAAGSNGCAGAAAAAGAPSAAASFTFTCRIGDFGLAVAREQGASMDWEEGDGDYVAPELLAVGGEPSPAADIFSLGATLYECATGQRLPRSNGWTESDVAALQLDSRPPAFVQLLRSMLQPSPALRPTAQQVIAAAAREQPAVAAASQAAVDAAAEAARAEEAAAEAALAARQAAAAAAQHAQQQQQAANAGAVLACSPAEVALQPSPFMVAALRRQSRVGAEDARQALDEAAASPQAGAPTPAPAPPTEHFTEQFSFDVPQCPPTGGFAFTPGQVLRPHNRRVGGSSGGGGGVPGSAMKSKGGGTPGGRSRIGHSHGRWAPALSPLISEGALTPGAAAGLAGLSPSPRREGPPLGAEEAPTPQVLALLGGGDACAGGSSGGVGVGVTPLDLRRPAPLQLPPQTVPMAILSSGGSGCGGQLLLGSGSVHMLGSGSTQDSGRGEGGWRLSRRDIVSPDSDFFNGSHSESDYSYSCGTGRTTSDMDFADALSPMSAELGFFGGVGHTPSTGTPESLRRESCTPGSGPAHLQAHPQQPTPPQHAPAEQQQQRQQLGPALAAMPVGPGLLGARMQAAPSLAWDLHTSPEFLMQLPPGSPDSLSRSSSLDDTASLPSRAVSIRRFPTLDSWGSHLDGACSKPPAPPSRADSLANLAAQRFTNTFVQPLQQGPHAAAVAAAQQQEQQQQGTAEHMAAAVLPPGVELVWAAAAGAAAAAAATGAAQVTAPLPMGARALRKRQHSSRRTLMAALSRDNSVASSMDGMAPQGKSRHIMESGANSPAAEMGGHGSMGSGSGELLSPGAGGHASGTTLASQGAPAMRRSASMLGREASASLALDAAAKALTAVAAAELPACGTGAGCQPVARPAPAAALQPLSPLADPTAAASAAMLCSAGVYASPFNLSACPADGGTPAALHPAVGQQGRGAVPPPSPLHARMTGLKLRGTD